MNSKIILSKFSACPILGSPVEFESKIVLPSTRSVLNFWQHLKIVETKPGIIPQRNFLTTKIVSAVMDICEPIHSEDLCVSTEQLSADQKYLFDIYNAVRNGSMSETLSVRDAGNVSHARYG